jgi:hypothetical protein
MNAETVEAPVEAQLTTAPTETSKEVEAPINQKQGSPIRFISIIKNHFKEWKWFYGILSIILANAISALSLICSSWSGWEARKATKISQQALELTKQSVEMQGKEFKLRNRPIIVIKSFSLTGVATDSSGLKFNHSLTYRIVNQAETLATHTECRTRIIGSQYALAPTIMNPSALAKEAEVSQIILLSDEAYSEITNSSKKVMIEIEITYSGMLGESNNEYRTFNTIKYSDVENVFKINKCEYR